MIRWLPALFTLSVPFTAAAQLPPLPSDPRLQEAYFAWDRGDYVEALEGYLAILSGSEGGMHVEEIALLTGELYAVDEIAPDGRAGLHVSSTGRYALYETSEEGRRVTRVVDLESEGATIATLPGVGASFVGPRAVAYLTVATPVVDRQIRVRALPSGSDETIELRGGWIPRIGSNSTVGVLTGALEADVLYVLASQNATGPATDILRIAPGGDLTVLDTGEGGKSGVLPVPGGETLVFTQTEGTGQAALSSIVVLELESGRMTGYPRRSAPSLSADGRSLVFLGREGSDYTVEVLSLAESGARAPSEVLRAPVPLAAPTLSPSGTQVAFQARPWDDWEIVVAPVNGGAARQITNEIQHDLAPRFLDEETVFAAKGEGRHRRSYLYDIATGRATKLFHNNTVRTISSEYEWQIVPGGRGILVVADRDGDTISPERGVYLLHLDRTVGADELRARLETNLAGERDLRARGERSFAPIAGEVAGIVEGVSVERIYQYARSLYGTGSKHITQPGNALAIAYLEVQLREWGYEPELQWFEPRPGIRSANVIARIPGTVDPHLVYVASSHFDSVEPGPGADDNSSGSSALLEAARVLRGHPQAATIELAFFTGEEAGLLGSREYVRRAVEEGKIIAGALNNDMIGWTNDHRLDNTIRYSNAGIRDIQHAAAFLFSELITFDSHYYQSTDAAAYYEAYGDIVGGIGSYPVLGNPHYHQPTDRLETVNQRLVAEVSRVTIATLALLASSPSRLTGVEWASGAGGSTVASWDTARESGVRAYRIRVTAPSGEVREREVAGGEEGAGGRVSLALDSVVPGSEVAVKAVNERGLEGWDWARAVVSP
jgi:hypothetical protein